MGGEVKPASKADTKADTKAASRTARTPAARRFRERYGPTALVTGAAQGIGLGFAESLAHRGLDVVLVDVQADRLRSVAQDIEARFGVAARPLAIDLSDRGFLERMESATKDLEIGLIVCNAALGRQGPFLEESVADLERAIDINCVAPIKMTRWIGPRLVARGRGGIILISSGTALQGSPNHASYAATKAFNLSLGESLWYEFADANVDVLAFIPGPTNTPGLRSVVPGLAEGVTVGPISLPGPTAEAALRALGQRASAARRPDHARRLAARRRVAEAARAPRSPGRKP